jgi:antitoxin component YwqK of YwqJK toxin-antitoxin module
MNRLIYTIFFFVIFSTVLGQINPVYHDTIGYSNFYIKETIFNLKDSSGLKQGLWIEKGILNDYTYYKDGKKNGLHLLYYLNGKLFYFGEFDADNLKGNHYVFHQNGILDFRLYNHRIVNFSISKPDYWATFKYLSNFVQYHSNGRIKCEGQLYHGDDIPVERLNDSIWNYYDLQGKLIKTERYKNGDIIK